MCFGEVALWAALMLNWATRILQRVPWLVAATPAAAAGCPFQNPSPERLRPFLLPPPHRRRGTACGQYVSLQSCQAPQGVGPSVT